MRYRRIISESVHEKFYHMATIWNQISIRQHNFIGKILRHKYTNPPTRIIKSWYNHRRRRGDVLKKKLIVRNIQIILSTTDKVGSI